MFYIRDVFDLCVYMLHSTIVSDLKKKITQEKIGRIKF